MQTYPIPEASLARIQQAYAAFEQLTGVIAEAMGIDINVRYRLDMEGRQFVTNEDIPVLNGVAETADVS